MALDKKKADAIKKVVYDLMDGLDPTGMNTEYYKSVFEKMSLEQFDKFLKNFFADELADLNLNIQHYVNDLTLDNIKKTADKMGVPLFERVALPFENPDGETYWTYEKVPVLVIHEKRVEQLVTKKNSMSIGIDKRDSKTGQVSGDDKNGRMSDMENIAVVTLGSEPILKEMMGPKSDDMYMKREMHKQIQTDGYVDIEKIKSSPTNKVALNTLDVYFTSLGLKTDLVTEGLLLKRTLQNLNRDNNSISSKGYVEI